MQVPGSPCELSAQAISPCRRTTVHPATMGYHLMHALKLIYLALLQLVKQAWLLPQSITSAIRYRRQQIAWDEHEAERLDRIRNPSKYLGK